MLRNNLNGSLYLQRRYRGTLSVGTKIAGPSWWLTLLPKFVESISAAEHAEHGLRLSL